MSKIATISTTVSTTTGLWAWVNDNSGALSVTIGLLSLCVALVFYILNYRKAGETSGLLRAELEHEILHKLIEAKQSGVNLAELSSKALLNLLRS